MSQERSSLSSQLERVACKRAAATLPGPRPTESGGALGGMAKSGTSVGPKRSWIRTDGHNKFKKENNTRKEPRSRASHRCSLRGINGDQPNEFSGVSKYSKYTYVVFARGTEDLPKGDCLKCEFSFKVGGWLAEFGSKDKFRAAREKDRAVQSAFTQCSSVWLQHHNAGKRCRNQSSNSRAKLGSNILDTVMDIRQNRKRIVKKKARRLKVKIRGNIFTPERYRAHYKRTIEKAGLTAKYYTIHGKKRCGEFWRGRLRMASTMSPTRKRKASRSTKSWTTGRSA